MSVSGDGDAARLAEAELELPLRRVRCTDANPEVAALVQLHRLLQHRELPLADAAEERDGAAVVRGANGSPERDARTARACDVDRQLVLLIDARLLLAAVEAKAGLEAARRAVVDQRVLRVRVDARIA